MIEQNTVFVLGAGASQAYGFPLGATLARQIWKGLRDRHSQLWRNLTSCGVSSQQIAAFTEAFATTDPDSLDDLVETRREFAELVKLAIACQLIPIELKSTQPRLYPDLYRSGKREAVDWYRYLLNEIMLSIAPNLIGSNRLAVVTFNFDTTFEQRLRSTVKGKFGLDTQDADAACKDIPVIHLHGQLDCHGTNKRGVVLQEDPELWQPDVVQSAARLKLASDEIETNAKDAAQSCLRQAKAVYFLGFGYHPTNLKQLGIPESINHASLAGTARGKTGVERSRIQADFRTTSAVDLQDVDILQFLRNNRVQ